MAPCELNMVSLRKFLSKEEQQAAASQEHDGAAMLQECGSGLADMSDKLPGYFALPLVQGIARTAVQADPEELATFQRTMNAILLALEQEYRPEGALVTIEQSIKVLEAYNDRVRATSRAHHDELRNMISLMVEAMAFLTASSKTSVEQLSSVEKSLEITSNLSDLRMIRNRVAACLAVVQTESARLKLQSDKKIKELKAAVLRASTQILPGVAATPPDPVTGLVGPSAVRELITRLLAAGKRPTVAAFVFDRIPELNRSLGRKAADRILSAHAQIIASEMAEFGPVLRWNGPAIILVLEETVGGANAVKNRIGQIAEKRLEFSLEMNGQSERFWVFFSWSVENGAAGDTAEDVCRRLDRFVSGRTESGASEAPASK